MLCAVEKDLAVEYATSLISRLSIEMSDGNDRNPIIVMADERGNDRKANFGSYFEEE